MRVIGMVLLCETLRSFAPSLAPCSPQLPRPASSLCPSCVSACPAAFFFVLCSRSLLLSRALRVPPALPRATRVPLPCAPYLACLPSHSPSRCRPCLYVCRPCLCRAVTRMCHPRALPLPLPLAPTLSPGCSPGPRLSPHPDCLAPCVGGGEGVSVVWTVALYPPCAGDASRIPAAALALWSPAALPKVRTRLRFVGVPWRWWPPRPGVVNPSVHGARKLNVFNASPSCHAESSPAMYQVRG